MPDTQYFTNIDGKYVKDAEARQQLNDLEDYVESLDQPWQPLQDGYSNFWFELTDDTLSPWLNFSAKTENAVIDWGDGSGEVALDTLTPTHTYSKAGKYVVKVKGVTGIAAQEYLPYTAYADTLQYIELNSSITVIQSGGFRGATRLKRVVLPSSITTMGVASFGFCPNIKEKVIIPPVVDIPLQCFITDGNLNEIEVSEGTTTIGGTAFYYCATLLKVVLPTTIQSIGSNAFYNCLSLSEVHVKAINPPTLANATIFSNLPSNWICYVPVGYGDTYKAASGWSTYADHILEEGQTPNRMMLAKFNSAKTEESEVKDDELHQDENR